MAVGEPIVTIFELMGDVGFLARERRTLMIFTEDLQPSAHRLEGKRNSQEAKSYIPHEASNLLWFHFRLAFQYPKPYSQQSILRVFEAPSRGAVTDPRVTDGG